MKIEIFKKSWELTVENNYVRLSTIIDENDIAIHLEVYVGRGDNLSEISTSSDIYTDIREKYDLNEGQSNALLHNEELAIMNSVAKEFGIDGFGGYGQVITPISKKFKEFLLKSIN